MLARETLHDTAIPAPAAATTIQWEGYTKVYMKPNSDVGTSPRK